jgi:hypothetical protein
VRVSQYSALFPVMRWDVSRAAEAAGVRNAIVLVRETWGAQLLARMWTLGVERPDAERIFQHVDACRLEGAITDLEARREAGSVTPGQALELLTPMMADSARQIASPYSPDSTERFDPGRPYRQVCADRINDDRGGTTLLPPLLLAHDDNVYVRDLHSRNRLILEQYPGRPVFLLHPRSARGIAPPVFYSLSRDSLIALGLTPAASGW